MAIRKLFILYEVTLIISTVLSYPNWIWYLFAYNFSGALFYLFKKTNFKLCWLDFFGNIGFPFFLGASIPSLILQQFGIDLTLQDLGKRALINFLLIIPFSWLITHYIEQPLLRWGKQIENKL